MSKIILLLIFFFSSNLLAATYLICESDNELLNVKLGNKKIHIQYKSEDFENYTSYLVKWNDELIKTERKIKYIYNKYDVCLMQNAGIKYYLYPNSVSSKVKKICEEVEDIDKEKERLEIIKINRLFGELNLDTGRAQFNIFTKKFDQKTIFNCKVQKKTLF